MSEESNDRWMYDRPATASLHCLFFYLAANKHIHANISKVNHIYPFPSSSLLFRSSCFFVLLVSIYLSAYSVCLCAFLFPVVPHMVVALHTCSLTTSFPHSPLLFTSVKHTRDMHTCKQTKQTWHGSTHLADL